MTQNRKRQALLPSHSEPSRYLDILLIERGLDSTPRRLEVYRYREDRLDSNL